MEKDGRIMKKVERGERRKWNNVKEKREGK